MEGGEQMKKEFMVEVEKNGKWYLPMTHVRRVYVENRIQELYADYARLVKDRPDERFRIVSREVTEWEEV